ncbi:MAG TPA: glycosyltransferase [Bryobacteraceae bacterium]|nr:glycosyltransferase [Bryobacteraceae bacterium]
MHDAAAAYLIILLWIILSSCSLLIWLYILFGRGGFWLVSRNTIMRDSLAEHNRRVAVVIPARNEADTISRTLDSLFSQNLVAPDIVLVDDGSDDGTAEIARSLAASRGRCEQLTILRGRPLVPGWTGKLWALSQGFEYAKRFSPDYVVFTDADITHEKDSLARLVNLAERKKLDLVSCMAKLACTTLAEKALIPAFVFFFLQLYPPVWVASPKRKTAAAAGGCVLLRPVALVQAGGIEAIRGAVIDDCALARLLKQNGATLWLGLTDEVASIRSYKTLNEIGRMISRSAFHQLEHSTLLLVATVIGLLITYLIPLLALTAGRVSATLGLLTLLLMAGSYMPMLRFYGQPIIWAFLLPVVALFYLGATIDSALKYWTGKGGAWKGRIQDHG